MRLYHGPPLQVSLILPNTSVVGTMRAFPNKRRKISRLGKLRPVSIGLCRQFP
jgi:hypothetical protein